MAWSGQSQQDCSKACQWQPFNHGNYKGRFTHAISFSEGESWSQIWISFWFPASMWHLLFTTLVLPLEKDWWEHTPLRTKTTNPRLSERGGLGPTPSELDSTVVRKRLNSESTKLQKVNQTNPCVFGCRKHFCLTQAATLSHEVQTEPKDRTVVFQKCHMFLICGQTNNIKLAFFYI